MKISKLFPYPDQKLLKKVVSGKRLQIASPFYSPASIDLINLKRTNRISFITRLPTQYNLPPAFIENDPKPFDKMMGIIGDSLEVYALPNLHAKLYLNERGVWVGSSNFTLNGFSGKQEILIHFNCDPAWNKVFDDYQKESTKVNKDNLEKLVNWIALGLTKIRNTGIATNGSTSTTSKIPFTFEDFTEWLNETGQPHLAVRKHILDRICGKNQMSGHVPPSFNGVMSFLRMHSDYIPRLLEASDKKIPSDILQNFALFIKKFGDQYRGSKGGYWRNYLSIKLGGSQNSGGAGDTVAKKCLVLIPAYINSRQEHQFG